MGEQLPVTGKHEGAGGQSGVGGGLRWLIGIVAVLIIGVGAAAYFFGGTNLFKGSLLEDLDLAPVFTADFNSGIPEGFMTVQEAGFRPGVGYLGGGLGFFGNYADSIVERDPGPATAMGTDDFAIFSWIKPTAVSDNAPRAIIAQKWDEESGRGYVFYITNNELGLKMASDAPAAVFSSAENDFRVQVPGFGAFGGGAGGGAPAKNATPPAPKGGAGDGGAAEPAKGGAAPVDDAGARPVKNAAPADDGVLPVKDAGGLAPAEGAAARAEAEKAAELQRKMAEREASERAEAERAEAEREAALQRDAAKAAARAEAEREAVQGEDVTVGIANYPINVDEWHHVGVTVDRDGDASFYVDGDFVGSASVASRNGDLANDAASLVIGKGFHGYFDEISIFRASGSDGPLLTAAQVKALYDESVAMHEAEQAAQADRLVGAPTVTGDLQFDVDETPMQLTFREAGNASLVGRGATYGVIVDVEEDADIDLDGVSIETPDAGSTDRYIILNGLDGLSKTYGVAAGPGDGVCYLDDNAATRAALYGDGATCIPCGGAFDPAGAAVQCEFVAATGAALVRGLTHSGVRLDPIDPNADDDEDGVFNATDNCPADSNPEQENYDDDALGDVCDPDVDGDGADNDSDACPDSELNDCGRGANGKVCIFGGVREDGSCASDFCFGPDSSSGVCTEPHIVANDGGCSDSRQCALTAGCRDFDDDGTRTCVPLEPQGNACGQDEHCQTGLSCRRIAQGEPKICLAIITDENQSDNYADSAADCDSELRYNAVTKRCELPQRQPACGAGQGQFNGACRATCPEGRGLNVRTGQCELTQLTEGQIRFANRAVGACAAGQRINPRTGACERECGLGLEDVNGQCVQACPDNKFRGADGQCSRACPSGNVRFDGQCVPACDSDNNEERDASTGLCAVSSCRNGFELFNNECVAVCDAGKVRDIAAGLCVAGSCPAGQAMNGRAGCVPLRPQIGAAARPAGGQPAQPAQPAQPVAPPVAARECSANVVSSAALLRDTLSRDNYQRITSAMNLMKRQNAHCPEEVFAYPSQESLPAPAAEPARPAVLASPPRLDCFSMTPSFTPSSGEKAYISCLLDTDVTAFKIQIITPVGPATIADENAKTAGLTLKSWNGEIDGTVVAPGTYNYIVTADNSAGQGSARGTIEVAGGQTRSVAVDQPAEPIEPTEPDTAVTVTEPESAVTVSADVCEQYFSDISRGDSDCAAAAFVRERGYFFGSGDSDRKLVKMDQAFNRVEFAAVVNRMLSTPPTSYLWGNDGNLGFSDITPDTPSWIALEIKRAVRAGAFQGFSDGTIRANQPLEESALWKTVLESAPGFDFSVDITKTPWYADYHKFVLDNDLSHRSSTGRGIVTRRAAIQFIYKLYLKGLL